MVLDVQTKVEITRKWFVPNDVQSETPDCGNHPIAGSCRCNLLVDPTACSLPHQYYRHEKSVYIPVGNLTPTESSWYGIYLHS